jgi:hypothetical protein
LLPEQVRSLILGMALDLGSSISGGSELAREGHDAVCLMYRADRFPNKFGLQGLRFFCGVYPDLSQQSLLRQGGH